MKIILSIIFLLLHVASYSNTDTLEAKSVKPKLIEQLTRKPVFNGDLNAYIYKNHRYPAHAQEYSVRGCVNVQFIIDEKGKVQDAKVISSRLGAGLDEEALRLVNAMPDWKPGMYGKKPVRVVYVLPVIFKLE